MKAIILTTIGIVILLLSNLPWKSVNNNSDAIRAVMDRKNLRSVACSPDLNGVIFTDEEIASMRPLPGTGSHTWKISSKNDSANFYFNQGMNLYYGFHIIEAIPSFKKAITFDPDCAMLHWGEALAYGPNINDLGYSASPDALAATEKAVQLAKSGSDEEKLLIAAMQQRYSADSSKKREWLNQQYAAAMRKAHQQFPEDAEIGALYADALMILHPWDLWFHDGQAKPWTYEIISVLESTLKYAPEHPGANHYYIHAVEASPNPGKATASADRLGMLTPGLSHMVHMPSHIYIRTGEFEKGVRVNREAVVQYNRYLKLFPEVASNAALYDLHNRHMQAVCSMNGNSYATALQDAKDCRNSFDTSFLSLAAPLGPYIQFVYMMPEFTMIYFERWDDILSQPLIERKDYSALLQQFARGMAFANKNQLLKAKSALQTMEGLSGTEGLALPFSPFNAPKEAALIAKEILLATILEKEGNVNQAQAHYKAAVNKEDALIYNEPRDWVLPARHFQGFALLRMQSYFAAEKVFREDLKLNPKNLKGIKGLQLAKGKRMR